MIKFTKVDKIYKGGEKSLSDVNVGIKQGEFVFLVGHSGAGKSTMLKLLLREEKISSGRLTVLGEDISKIKNKKMHLFRRKLGVIFQDFRLLKDKTAYENVELSMRVVGTRKKDIKLIVLLLKIPLNPCLILYEILDIIFIYFSFCISYYNSAFKLYSSFIKYF